MNTVDTITILKSLADGTRLSIVRRLAQNECAVASSDIITACAESLQLAQPTMSHHFARLVQAGVLREHKTGTVKSYQLDRQRLADAGIDVTKL